MLVYRLSLTRFADNTTGFGAKAFGGRWNHIDTPCLYTSESRALAVLEYAANVPLSNIPHDLSIVCFDVPVKKIPVINEKDLSGNWRESPAPYETKQLGTEWLKGGKGLVMKVPSVILPEEFNILINPLHPDIRKITVVDIVPYTFDTRIKQ